MTYGIKVAKTGKSVTSTEPRDFIFNSEYETIKIYAEAGGSQSVSAGSTYQVSITHNLGFIPMCWVFTESTTGHWYCGCFMPSQADGFPSSYVNLLPGSSDTYADNTYLKFKLNNATAGTKTIKYYYFIFGDDGI